MVHLLSTDHFAQSPTDLLQKCLYWVHNCQTERTSLLFKSTEEYTLPLGADLSPSGS